MDWLPLRFIEYSRGSPSDSIKRSPRWDNEEGVASTVGTIMSLMVFLTLMGMFTNQFVPIWMGDNESAHMSVVVDQFVTLKSQIDGLVADYSNSLIASTPLAVPITLSATGIPVFAGPTAGILDFQASTITGWPSLNISYSSYSIALGPSNDGHTGGYLQLWCPNRYYVDQKLIYEGGAVILNQTDGEFMIAGMQLSVTNYVAGGTTNRIMKITQVDLLGLDKTIGGTGSKMVNADLLYAATTAYNSTAGAPVTITIATAHGVAWENYFKKVLNASLADLAYGTDFTVTKTVYNPTSLTDKFYIVQIVINNISVLDHTRATIQMSVGDLGV
jgi:hypothetical protein